MTLHAGSKIELKLEFPAAVDLIFLFPVCSRKMTKKKSFRKMQLSPTLWSYLISQRAKFASSLPSDAHFYGTLKAETWVDGVRQSYLSLATCKNLIKNGTTLSALGIQFGAFFHGFLRPKTQWLSNGSVSFEFPRCVQRLDQLLDFSKFHPSSCLLPNASACVTPRNT